MSAVCRSGRTAYLWQGFHAWRFRRSRFLLVLPAGQEARGSPIRWLTNAVSRALREEVAKDGEDVDQMWRRFRRDMGLRSAYVVSTWFRGRRRLLPQFADAIGMHSVSF